MLDPNLCPDRSSLSANGRSHESSGYIKRKSSLQRSPAREEFESPQIQGANP